MLIKFLDIAIGGLLMGGIYALIAVGFGLQYGVARVLNIAHGEFIMLGAFCTWTLFTSAGITPMVSMLFCAPFFFAIGFHRSQGFFQLFFQFFNLVSTVIG